MFLYDDPVYGKKRGTNERGGKRSFSFLEASRRVLCLLLLGRVSHPQGVIFGCGTKAFLSLSYPTVGCLETFGSYFMSFLSVQLF